MRKRYICLRISQAAGLSYFFAAGTLFFFLLISANVNAEAKTHVQADQKVPGDNFFAVINGEKIELSDFLYTFSKGVKEKFYHGKVSQEQLNAFKKEVAEKLVLEILLSTEARKRGLKVDKEKFQAELDKYNVELGKDPSKKEKEDLEKFRKEALPTIKASVEREQLIELLRRDVENIKPPPVKEVKQYYLANKDKFTAPQRWDVSVILLPVDPSASSEEWDKTVEKADQLLKKIRKGENFEELARIHSGDSSAVNGGHMGYMHIGMFGEPAQKVLNVMGVGEISEPVVLLEGVAIFRLNAIEKAELNPFGDVEERARKLLIRELVQKTWADFKVGIRKTAKVEFSELLTQDNPKPDVQR